ncbi:MAG TPA: hydroxyisourate hydrolase [Devosiaceae bacterium]
MSSAQNDGRLTTHVLDTMNGRPAAGMGIDLYRCEGDVVEPILSARTNADGRCDGPLLQGERFEAGAYELRFHVGSYFRQSGVSGEPAFLEIVPVRFTITDPDAHYHVPLLVAPYAYSTYRGS